MVESIVHRSLCGIFVRRERWGLSWKGWLGLAVALMVCGLLVALEIHPFLAITSRTPSRFLVVEGWIHDYAIHAAAEEFRTGGYERVFTTGGPVMGLAVKSDYETSASVGAELLKSAGVPGNSVQMVPARLAPRDRTYSSAVALHDWFAQHGMRVPSFNVLTEDAHARRTRLMFQRAFGNGTTIGIISVPSPDYEAKRWWHYSEGVREVTSETIAYVYARLFFHASHRADFRG